MYLAVAIVGILYPENETENKQNWYMILFDKIIGECILEILHQPSEDS